MTSVYKLSFGTAVGICVGLFVVKGVKFFAISLGGVFVLLQVSLGAFIPFLTAFGLEIVDVWTTESTVSSLAWPHHSPLECPH